MHRITKKSVVIATSALVVLAGTGVAVAYWTGGGSGTGTAMTGTSTALSVNQLSDLTAMYPGDSPQTLSGDFDNTSSGPIHVTSVVVSIAGVTRDGDPVEGCSAADYTVTGATMSAVQDVAVGSGVGSWSGATIQFNDTSANQDACQGATVDLAYQIV
jgi:hypothetical protein